MARSTPGIPIVPGEIAIHIIDHLALDTAALGLCGLVCLDWLCRSRYHLFTTIRLRPQVIRQFMKLTTSPFCTLVPYVRRIEMDYFGVDASADQLSLYDSLYLSHLPLQLESFRLANFDWMTCSPQDQSAILRRLSKFSTLKYLELHGVTFHDLRSLLRLVASFPSLQDLSAHVHFLQYLKSTCSSAEHLRLPTNLRSIELGTADGIPVVLSCLSASGHPSHLQTLHLHNLTSAELDYVRFALQVVGTGLRHLLLGFSNGQRPRRLQGSYFLLQSLATLSHSR